ncbi:MAG: hypothetical protein QOD45_175 [Pseudonocardiales bacterium]|nr:hypothetical protein [Pseudonocardiales bacterium]
MHQLTSTTGIVALAAGGVAVVALVLALTLALRLRRLRQAQSTVLGAAGERDLVAHAERLETGFTDLREWVEETMERIGQRMDITEGRLDGCVAHTALVRYDAYNELSGHQSSSIALLDARRSGVVLSSIVHRDQARLYVKQVRNGEAEIALSPEEQEAIDTALAPLRDAA